MLCVGAPPRRIVPELLPARLERHREHECVRDSEGERTPSSDNFTTRPLQQRADEVARCRSTSTTDTALRSRCATHRTGPRAASPRRARPAVRHRPGSPRRRLAGYACSASVTPSAVGFGTARDARARAPEATSVDRGRAAERVGDAKRRGERRR